MTSPHFDRPPRSGSPERFRDSAWFSDEEPAPISERVARELGVEATLEEMTTPTASFDDPFATTTISVDAIKRYAQLRDAERIEVAPLEVADDAGARSEGQRASEDASASTPTPADAAVASRSIGRISALIGSGTLISRLLGFVKAAVIAATIGVVNSPGGDAYASAMNLPNAIYSITAGGVLNAVLLPQVVRAARHDDGGNRFINRLITAAMTIVLAVTVIVTIGAPVLTWVYGSQLTDAQRGLVTAMAYWCLPQVFFFGLYAVLGEVLNARGAFGPYTWAPVLNNLIAIPGLILFAVLFGADPSGHRAIDDWSPSMIAVLAGSATLGVACQALVLFLFWRRIGLRFRLDFHWRGVGLGQAGKLAGWTFGMLLITTIAGVFQMNALGRSFGEYPSIATSNNAWLLFMLPHSVIALSIVTAYYTRMSALARDGDMRGFLGDFSKAVRTIALFITLAMVGLIVIAVPTARLWLAPDGVQAERVGLVIAGYALGLVNFCTLFVVQRAFYALQDTRTPFFFTLVQALVVVTGCLVSLAVPVEVLGVFVALTITVAGAVQCALGVVLLRRKLGRIDGRRILGAYTRYALAGLLALIAGLAVSFALGAFDPAGFAVSTRITALIAVLIAGVATVVVYVVALIALRSPELGEMVRPLVRRLRRGRAS